MPSRAERLAGRACSEEWFRVLDAGRACSEEWSRVLDALTHQASLLVAVRPVTAGVTDAHTVRFKDDWMAEKTIGFRLKEERIAMRRKKRIEQMEIGWEAGTFVHKFYTWLHKKSMASLAKKHKEFMQVPELAEMYTKMSREEPSGWKPPQTDKSPSASHPAKKHAGSSKAHKAVSAERKAGSEQLIKHLREKEMRLKKELKPKRGKKD
ncbi:hypothetical protein PMIN06_008534 [Paraphaeosphaeria minitans]|uniref:Uncharacterized protein n=1 Tax=Paraphaeosphaeria minitans TaxID=565426 RepID=A0A9P6GA49_9PLEO|nr:hypothetical protein PMIN01_10744 [Paraphaeosphaeria minitans]